MGRVRDGDMQRYRQTRVGEKLTDPVAYYMYLGTATSTGYSHYEYNPIRIRYWYCV